MGHMTLSMRHERVGVTWADFRQELLNSSYSYQHCESYDIQTSSGFDGISVDTMKLAMSCVVVPQLM